MYLQHFGMKEPPFALTPDPDYFYNFSGHQKALNVLRVALQNGEGLIKITGEVGTGKTLLCRKLLAALKGKCQVVFIANPQLFPDELYKALAAELGLDVAADASTYDLVKQITARLVQVHRERRRTILCLDEVQTMPRESLEALRLLSNLETDKRKLIQIVLFAQPELNTILEQPDMRQLRQRIGFSFDLPPLDRQGVAGYVRHRLKVAGHDGDALFSEKALDLLFRASRGIPRLVNLLGHKALLAAYGAGASTVGPVQVRLARDDTEAAKSVATPGLRTSFYWIIGVVTLVELAIVVYLLQRLLP